MKWALRLFEDESACLLTGIKIVPLIFATRYMFMKRPAPHFIADVHAEITTIITNENEASVRMILQVAVDPNAFIFIQGFNEIQQITLIPDRPLGV